MSATLRETIASFNLQIEKLIDEIRQSVVLILESTMYIATFVRPTYIERFSAKLINRHNSTPCRYYVHDTPVQPLAVNLLHRSESERL